MSDGLDKRKRIQKVLDRCIKALSEESPLNVEQLFAAHPELMPELREELQQLLAIENGVRGLDIPDIDTIHLSDLDTHSGAEPVHHVEGTPGFTGTARKHYPKIDGYRIIGVLGQGGMGIVYRAVQTKLDRTVALKVLPAVVGTANPATVARFRREAQAAARLHHTHIVPVYDYGESHDSYFFSMELVQGFSLEHLVSELGRMETVHISPLRFTRIFEPVNQEDSDAWNEQSASSLMPGSGIGSGSSSGQSGRHYFNQVAMWIANAANALQYAHSDGIIHRDIKPSNLLLTADRRIMIADFGLAKLTDETSNTMTGSLLGTMRYMSPEQAMAKRMPLDHRTDIYSLGTTMYELLTFQPAFDAEDNRSVLGKIVTQDPIPPRKINSSVPRELETICLKAMEKSPGARYATARAMEEDLHRYIKDLPILAKSPSVGMRILKFARRHRAMTLSAALLVALGIASVLFVQWQREKKKSLAKEIENLRGRGIAYALEEHWDQAEGMFKQILGLDGGNAGALANLCWMRVKQYNASRGLSDGDLLAQAETDCKRAIEISGFHKNALNYLGVIYKKLGRYQEAMESYNRILEKDKTAFAVRANKGSLHAMMKDLDAAYDELKKSTLGSDVGENCPHAVDTWRNLGALQLHLGENDKGLESLNEAQACNRNDLGVSLLRAKYYLHSDLRKAQDNLAIARSNCADCEEERLHRIDAQISLALGDYSAAAESARRAMDAGDMRALNHLIISIARANQGEPRAAQRELGEAQKHWPAELKQVGGFVAMADNVALWFDTAEELINLKAEAERALAAQSHHDDEK